MAEHQVRSARFIFGAFLFFCFQFGPVRFQSRSRTGSLAAFGRITRAAFPRTAPPPCRRSALEFKERKEEGGKEGKTISAADGGDVTVPVEGGKNELK